MNGEMMVKMLYQMHTHNTLYNPICYHDHNTEKIPNDLKLSDDYLKHCMKIYKTTAEGALYGSVDVDPSFWYKIWYAKITEAKKNGVKIAKLPNGCCTTVRCGIRKFYEILSQEINNK